MKKNLWMIVGLVISTSVLADDQLQNPAPAAPPDTNAPMTAPAAPMEPAPAIAPAAESAPAPAKHAKKKKSAKAAKSNAGKPEVEETVSLVPGPATVSAKATLNVRGQAKVGSEVISHLKSGDTVTVIEQMNLKKGEPRQWAKIVLPADAKVWIFSSLVDSGAMTVKAKKANLRSGPGENFSIVGTLEQGAAVKQVVAKGEWMQIEAPAGSYAFVAAQFLHQEPVPAEVAAVAPETMPTNAAPVDIAAADNTNAPMVATETPAPAEPVAVPRVVSHEGVVRPTVHPNAPTKFQLVNLQTDTAVDFIYSTNADLDLKDYNGRMVIVTGEEAMDERWKSIPVLTVQRLQVAE